MCWKRTNLLLVLLALAMLSTGCADTLTPIQQAQATAVAGGCWPYGIPQPSPAMPTEWSLTPTAIGISAPTAAVYPICTPVPGVLTLVPTLIPMRPRVLPPPSTGTRMEVSNSPGKTTNQTAALANDGRMVVGWLAWGATGEVSQDGQVWVRTQRRDGFWENAQTLTSAPVNGGVGGLGLAWGITDTVVAAWGDGRDRVLMATSADGGKTWGATEDLGGFAYQVIDLVADPAGGLHLLALTPVPHHVLYVYRTPGGIWQAPVGFGTQDQFQATLAVLPLPNGTIRRFVAVTGSTGLLFYRSDDGLNWTAIPVETGRSMPEQTIVAPAVLAASRSAGDLVALTWSQYSAGGVFGQVSTDGGLSWSHEEVIAQHRPDGGCYSASGEEGLACGYAPSPAYDSETDQLAVAWAEVVRQRTPPQRVRLSYRSLDVGVWHFAITPELRAADAAPALTGWGWEGFLVSSGDSQRHVLISQDRRNDQYRLYVTPLVLASFLREDPS